MGLPGSKKRKRRRAPHIAADLSTKAGRRRARSELVWGDHGFLRARFSNLHQISGEMWRANQPSPERVAFYARELGIRTIVNLRGTSTRGFYLLEREACARHGVQLVDFPVYSRDTPSVETILAARDLFASLHYPALMHCKSGADRAGIMSVLYKLLREDTPLDEAMQQLSPRYLHVRWGKTGVLDAVFEAYRDDYANRSKPFLQWVMEDYDRAEVKREFMQRFEARLGLDRLLRRE